MSSCACHQTFEEVLTTVNTRKEEVINYREKQQEIIDNFLDAVLEFNAFLNRISSELDTISEEIIKLTWKEKPEGECYSAYLELLEAGNKLHKSLIMKYVSYANFRRKGISKNEIKNFKQSVDNFHESLEDLRLRFSDLCDDAEIVQLTKEIEDLFTQ